MVQYRRKRFELSLLKALKMSLYLSGWLLISTMRAVAAPQALSENTEIMEHQHSLKPLAELPALGAFCVFQYPDNIRQCQLAMTYLIQLRILDWNYLSPHSRRLWHDVIFWVSFLIMAKTENPGFDGRQFPDFENAFYIALLVRCLESGADTATRMLGYWPQNVDKSYYVLIEDFVNSIATGIIIGSLFFLKPSVAMAYKIAVPIITAMLTMVCSFILRGGDVDIGLAVKDKAVVGTIVVVGAGAGAIAIAIVIAEAGAVAGVAVGAIVGAIAGVVVGAIAGAIAVALTVAEAEAEGGAGAGAIALVGAAVEAIAVTGAGAGAGAVAGTLFHQAIRAVALYNFDVMAAYLPYKLFRLGLLFVITELTALTVQILSGTNSGLTLSASYTLAVKKFYDGYYNYPGASIAFWTILWTLLKVSQPHADEP